MDEYAEENRQRFSRARLGGPRAAYFDDHEEEKDPHVARARSPMAERTSSWRLPLDEATPELALGVQSVRRSTRIASVRQAAAGVATRVQLSVEASGSLVPPLATNAVTSIQAMAAPTNLQSGPVPARTQRKRGRLCKAEGCDNYIVHKGLCCRHGGGKRCAMEGCTASAKHRGLCWRHGGSTECRVDGCTNRAKAKGVCWSHGGGTQCSHDDCTKIAVSGGACWAHGGGKRCIHDGCQRPAYARTHNFCEKHYRELRDVDYYEV